MRLRAPRHVSLTRTRDPFECKRESRNTTGWLVAISHSTAHIHVRSIEIETRFIEVAYSSSAIRVVRFISKRTLVVPFNLLHTLSLTHTHILCRSRTPLVLHGRHREHPLSAFRPPALTGVSFCRAGSPPHIHINPCVCVCYLVSVTPPKLFLFSKPQKKNTRSNMSWQDYVDNQLLASQCVSRAAIAGHDGGVWAKSNGFEVGSWYCLKGGAPRHNNQSPSPCFSS